MKPNGIRWSITVGSVALLVAHCAFPRLTLDTTSVILLIIALIPWLAPVIKSIELPGGFKIEVKDVKEATDKATRELLAQPPAPTSPAASVQPEAADPFATLRELSETDPNLAIVGFRIEIERRLAVLAARYQLDARRRSAGQLLRMLQAEKIIPSSLASGLADLIGLGNQAAHGADVSQDAAQWMLEVGPNILGILDRLITS